jgi:hypothetical protein
MIYMAITIGTLVALVAAMALSIWSERQTAVETVVKATAVSHCKVCATVITTGMVTVMDNGGHVCNRCYTWSVIQLAKLHGKRRFHQY